jgi:hypothetical protein
MKRMVKRIVAGGLATLAYLVIMPVLVLAQTQEGSSLGKPEGPAVGGTGGVLGSGGEAGAGTAFTGAELTGLMLLAVVLAGAGIAALVMARRRSVGSRVQA